MKITPEIVRELLDYNPETGIFTWRQRDRKWFKTDQSHRAWNTKYTGKRAGGLWRCPKSGYQSRQIVFLGRHHKEHRIAWTWMTDDPLPEEIDHENRDGTDNRWSNLRASNRSANKKNLSMRRNNTSGVTGVYWSKSRGKWKAQAGIHGKVLALGSFDEIDEAAMAVLEFKAEHGFDPGHGLEIAHYHAELALCHS